MRRRGETEWETGKVRGKRGKWEDRKGRGEREREREGRKAAGKLLAGRGINERQCY